MAAAMKRFPKTAQSAMASRSPELRTARTETAVSKFSNTTLSFLERVLQNNMPAKQWTI